VTHSTFQLLDPLELLTPLIPLFTHQPKLPSASTTCIEGKAHKSGFSLIIRTSPFWDHDRMNIYPRMDYLDILDKPLDPIGVRCIA
jgi:hypothetical protein